MSVSRNLFAYAIKRRAGTQVILVYKNVGQDNGDGSFTLQEKKEYVRGFLVDMTDNAIERLKEGGITVNKGVILSIPYPLTNAPDEVFYGSSRGRVVKFTIAESISVMTLDIAPLGYAITPTE